MFLGEYLDGKEHNAEGGQSGAGGPNLEPAVFGVSLLLDGLGCF